MKTNITLLSLIVLGAVLLSACASAATPTPTPTPVATSQPSSGVANPASQYCVNQGYKVELRTVTDGSQYGVCKFTDGTECEEWSYFRKECSVGQYKVAPTPAAQSTPSR